MSHIINISSKKKPKSYKLICKLILRKYGILELRSLGNAAESVVILSHTLVHNKLAEFKNIDSNMTNLEDINNEGGVRRGI